MSVREEQCNKVCRILDDVLANRPTERDSLIVAVRKAFEALELFGNSEPLPSAEPERKLGRWIEDAESFYKAVNEKGGGVNENTPYFTDDIACSECLSIFSVIDNETERFDFCPSCGADMRGGEK